MDGATINLLIQAGVAGVFAAFAVVLIRLMIEFLAEQNNAWREMLQDERQQRLEIMRQAQESLKDLVWTVESFRAQIKEGRERHG